MAHRLCAIEAITSGDFQVSRLRSEPLFERGTCLRSIAWCSSRPSLFKEGAT